MQILEYPPQHTKELKTTRRDHSRNLSWHQNEIGFGSFYGLFMAKYCAKETAMLAFHHEQIHEIVQPERHLPHIVAHQQLCPCPAHQAAGQHNFHEAQEVENPHQAGFASV